MTGNINDEFQNFFVKLPEGKRYWEDDGTGLIIKKGQTAEVNRRQFRSSELRFGLLRSQVLIESGQCVFVFRDKLVKVTPGDKKNIIVDLVEIQNEKETKPVEENVKILDPKKEEVKEAFEETETTLDSLEE